MLFATPQKGDLTPADDAADVSRDGRVTSLDALMLLQPGESSYRVSLSEML